MKNQIESNKCPRSNLGYPNLLEALPSQNCTLKMLQWPQHTVNDLIKAKRHGWDSNPGKSDSRTSALSTQPRQLTVILNDLESSLVYVSP